MLAIALIFIAALIVCCTIGLTILLSMDRNSRIRRARMVRYQASSTQAEILRVRQRVELATAPTAEVKSLTARWTRDLRHKMREAGMSLSLPALFMMMGLLAILVALPIIVLKIFPPVLALALGGAAGYLGLNTLLNLKRGARINAFNAALPAVLDILARSVRAGQPITAAIGIVTQYTSGIAQEEFERAAEQLRLGMTLDDALMRMAANVGTPEIRFIAAAIRLQTETGGNLVETLENMSSMLRERMKLKKKAAALSAEAKVSAFILSALPFLVAASLVVLNPTYLKPLVEDQRGLVMLAGGFALLLLGIYSMYKLAKIEV